MVLVGFLGTVVYVHIRLFHSYQMEQVDPHIVANDEGDPN